MSTGSDPKMDANLIEQARRQVNRLAEEIAHLSEMDLGPPEYYGEFLQRVLSAVAAPAGAIWLRTSQGNLQLQYQIRMREVGLDTVEHGRQIHDELLREVVMKGQPAMLAPQSGLGTPEEGKLAPGNPTNYVILIAPILVDRQVAGLVEVWQDPNRGPDAQRGFLQFIIRMTGLASNYTRNFQLRQMSSQQQVWTQLESFSRQVHNSLNPTEVAYLVANEGRRLIECDRVSVAVREGGHAVVRAISGADVIEKRSNLVQLMRKLFDEVLIWGEKLVYSGTKDESLPPKVLRALDGYLAESNSKLLVIMPLRDDRETNKKNPSRSALMMESFEPSMAPEQLVARMEIVAKHATSAIYNASEYRVIPFRWVWLPMARVQEGLGGKTKAIISLITIAAVALLLAMIVVPYPLKMDANGQLLPKERAWIFSQVPAVVVDFNPSLKNDQRMVAKNQELVLMESIDLAGKIRALQTEIANAQALKDSLSAFLRERPNDPEGYKWINEKIKAEATYLAKINELRELRDRTNATIPNKEGQFWLKSPLAGEVLTSDFQEKLRNRPVQPNEPLLRIGKVNLGKRNLAEWEVELKIPQKHIGQVLAAYRKNNDPKEELDVDFLLRSRPTEVFSGKLARRDISPEANPETTDKNEPEPMVLARVRISGEGIAEGYQLPVDALLTGTEVHSRIRCGNYPMGYSLFYGVWEFFYEKVVFPYF